MLRVKMKYFPLENEKGAFDQHICNLMVIRKADLRSPGNILSKIRHHENVTACSYRSTILWGEKIPVTDAFLRKTWRNRSMR